MIIFSEQGKYIGWRGKLSVKRRFRFFYWHGRGSCIAAIERCVEKAQETESSYVRSIEEKSSCTSGDARTCLYMGSTEAIASKAATNSRDASLEALRLRRQALGGKPKAPQAQRQQCF